MSVQGVNDVNHVKHVKYYYCTMLVATQIKQYRAKPLYLLNKKGVLLDLLQGIGRDF